MMRGLWHLLHVLNLSPCSPRHQAPKPQRQSI